MTISVTKIRDLADYLVKDYHNNRVLAQKIDETYIQDTFDVPFIKKSGKNKIVSIKTGKGFRMTNAPAEHIITSTPQVYRTSRRDTDTQKDKRVTSELNRWAKVLLHQNPQPYKEYVKKLLSRGESWLYVIHNNKFDESNQHSIPVNFINLDPMIVFGDIGEVNGVPPGVVIYCERTFKSIKQAYPFWTGSKVPIGTTEKTKLPFLVYFDKDVRYFEAAGEALLTDDDDKISNGDGIQENIYGFVPLVHSYSGFGTESVDADPMYLAVSRIRYCRDLIGQYAAIGSLINHLVFKYAHPPVDYMYDPTLIPDADKIIQEYSYAEGDFNKIPITPGGGLKKGMDMLPEQQLWQHLNDIERRIDEEDPLGKIGGAIGTSGRQQLDAEASGLRRYDTIVENTQHAFETAMGMALKEIEIVKKTDSGKSLYSNGLKEGDIDSNYELRLELKAEDPIANQIRSSDGDRKWTAGIIDAETNLTKFQGFTSQEAQKIINNRVVEDVVLNDPVIKRLIALHSAKEQGLEQEYTEIEQQLNEMGKGLSTAPQMGSQGGEPRTGNIKTPLGTEMVDMSLQQRPTRLSPTGV